MRIISISKVNTLEMATLYEFSLFGSNFPTEQNIHCSQIPSRREIAGSLIIACYRRRVNTLNCAVLVNLVKELLHKL